MKPGSGPSRSTNITKDAMGGTKRSTTVQIP